MGTTGARNKRRAHSWTRRSDGRGGTRVVSGLAGSRVRIWPPLFKAGAEIGRRDFGGVMHTYNLAMHRDDNPFQTKHSELKTLSCLFGSRGDLAAFHFLISTLGDRRSQYSIRGVGVSLFRTQLL